MSEAVVKLTQERGAVIEERARELRHLQAKAAEIDEERLRVEILGDAEFCNVFAVIYDVEGEEPKLLGERLTFTKTSGFLEGVEAARSLVPYWW